MANLDSAGEKIVVVPAQNERLDSWKQIASYLKRDIRTVQRWEKLEGLPVHRHQHQKRGSAFAYVEELDAWWAGRGQELAAVETVTPPVVEPTLTSSVLPDRVALRWTIFAAICLLPILLMFKGIGAVRPHPVQRLQAIAPLDTKISVHPVISPDGTKIAFVGADAAGIAHLWIRSLDSLNAQLLPGTQGAAWPFWSADGREMAFFAGGKLKRTALDAQTPQVICDAPNGRGGTWNGNIIVFAPFISGALYEVSPSGGTPRPLTVLDESKRETSHRWPQFLPDGRHLIFFVLGGKDINGMYIGSLDSRSHTRLLANDSSAVYADGHLIFWREGGLAAQRMDATTGKLIGEVLRMSEDPGYNHTYGIGPFSVSNTGALVYQDPGRSANRLVWLNRAGREIDVAGPPMTGVSWLALSPNEQQVAIQRYERDSQKSAIWLGDLTRGGWSRFTSTDSGAWWPVWSPDGRQIAFSLRQEHGLQAIYQKSTDAGGPVKALVQWPTVLTPTDWSSDGRFLLFQSVGSQQNRHLSALPVSGGSELQEFPNSEFDEIGARFSPDGKWVAFVSNESDVSEVYVQAFPPNGRKVQISTTGGYQPRWRKDGREMYYITPDRQLMSVALTPGSSFHVGTPQRLFDLPIENPAMQFASSLYDVTADGQRFLASRLITSDSDSIAVVLNWTAALNH